MYEAFQRGFLEQLSKLAEDEGAPVPQFMDQESAGLPEPSEEPENAEVPEAEAHPPEVDDERSKAERLVDEGVGNLASSDARRELEEKLRTTDGREEIRAAYRKIRDKINAGVRERKAFTRSLLRARRSVYGPSAEPRNDLRSLLYSGEPFFDASYVR